MARRRRKKRNMKGKGGPPRRVIVFGDFDIFVKECGVRETENM